MPFIVKPSVLAIMKFPAPSILTPVPSTFTASVFAKFAVKFVAPLKVVSLILMFVSEDFGLKEISPALTEKFLFASDVVPSPTVQLPFKIVTLSLNETFDDSPSTVIATPSTLKLLPYVAEISISSALVKFLSDESKLNSVPALPLMLMLLSLSSSLPSLTLNLPVKLASPSLMVIEESPFEV